MVLFLLIVVPRVSFLTSSLTSDEKMWMSRASYFISAIEELKFRKAFVNYHPGVTTGWIAGISLRVKSLLVPNENFDAAAFARCGMALVISLMILGIFLLICKLFNRTIALIAGLFMAFDPFYVAHSGYVLTDALFTTFMGLAILSFLVFLEKGSGRGYAILSGFSGGLALLTRSTGLFLFPFIFLILLLFHRVKAKNTVPLSLSIQIFLGWMATSLLTFSLLWPKVWVISISIARQTLPCFPLLLVLLLLICYWGIIKVPSWRSPQILTKKTYSLLLIGGVCLLVFTALLIGLWREVPFIFQRMIAVLLFVPHENPQIFLGQSSHDPGALLFPVVLILRTPPLTLLLLLLSIPYLFYGRMSRNFRWSLLTLWLYIVLFTVAVSIPAKKLPRYILPVFPFIDLLAGFALYRLVRYIINWQWLRTFISEKLLHFRRIEAVTFLALLIYLVPIGYQFSCGLSVYPYYLAYYSPIWGGRANVPNLIRVGRGEGIDQVQAYLDRYITEPTLTSEKRKVTYHHGVVNTKNNRYKVLYVRSVSAGVPQEEVMRYYINEIPEHVVQLGGIDYAWIYKNREKASRRNVIPSFLREAEMVP